MSEACLLKVSRPEIDIMRPDGYRVAVGVVIGSKIEYQASLTCNSEGRVEQHILAAALSSLARLVTEAK